MRPLNGPRQTMTIGGTCMVPKPSVQKWIVSYAPTKECACARAACVHIESAHRVYCAARCDVALMAGGGVTSSSQDGSRDSRCADRGLSLLQWRVALPKDADDLLLVLASASRAACRPRPPLGSKGAARSTPSEGTALFCFTRHARSAMLRNVCQQDGGGAVQSRDTM